MVEPGVVESAEAAAAALNLGKWFGRCRWGTVPPTRRAGAALRGDNLRGAHTCVDQRRRFGQVETVLDCVGGAV
jgi:hypothetical protein